ncbi:DNA primase [Moraxella ovis]|uniref:DNA primase n=2 Tax=Moraxella ovis TaxID=29433 RepID=A0A378PL91_9GAMM|nr:CHC2 zinc finger domain-containing protein [Moraxella ovis]STY87514.1 DNA primase [Moraxella ovis]
MTNAHELLNRPLFAKNAFFNKRPFANQQNAHSHATSHAQHPHGKSYHPHPTSENRPHTSENRAVGKHGMGNHQHAMRFDTNDKPDPVSFYARYGIHLKGKQTNIKCVFHSDKTPSLSINRDTGAFYCFGCGASGGDVLDFYQRYHGVDFLTACKELNIYER